MPTHIGRSNFSIPIHNSQMAGILNLEELQAKLAFLCWPNTEHHQHELALFLGYGCICGGDINIARHEMVSTFCSRSSSEETSHVVVGVLARPLKQIGSIVACLFGGGAGGAG
jgi:hypothetical protein